MMVKVMMIKGYGDDGVVCADGGDDDDNSGAW